MSMLQAEFKRGCCSGKSRFAVPLICVPIKTGAKEKRKTCVKAKRVKELSGARKLNSKPKEKAKNSAGKAAKANTKPKKGPGRPRKITKENF